MFTTEQLIKFMEGGKSVDEIASEFTKNLNAAAAEIKRKETERKLKEAEEKEKRARKLAMAKTAVDSFLSFGERYYPDIFVPEVRQNLNIETLVDTMDKVYKEMAELPFPSIIPVEKKVEEKKVAGDPIKSFLIKNNLF